jgi:hypothetical protein
LWLVQLSHPEEELVILPLASLEVKEKLEISRFSFLWLQRGQTITSWLLRTRYSKLKPQLMHAYSYMGIYLDRLKLIIHAKGAGLAVKCAAF